MRETSNSFFFNKIPGFAQTAIAGFSNKAASASHYFASFFTEDQLAALKVFADIAGKGIFQLMSDTYAIRSLFLGSLFLNRLHLDSEHVDANGISASMLLTLLISVVSPIFSTAILTGELFGKLQSNQNDGDLKNKIAKEIVSVYRNALLYIGAVVAPLTIFPMYFSKKILTSLFSQNETIAGYAQNFLRPLSLYGVFVGVSMAATQLMIANEKSRLLLLSVLLLVPSLFLTDALCFGKYGMPKIGAAGVALGYTISALAEALLNSMIVFRHPAFKALSVAKNLFQPFDDFLSGMSRWLKTSAALVLPIFAELALNFALNTMCFRFGVASQAAFGLILQWVQISVSVLVNFGLSIMSSFAIQVGILKDAVEKNNALIEFQSKNSLRNISRVGVPMMTALGWLIAFPLAFAPNRAAALFGSDRPEMQGALNRLGPLVATGLFFEAINFALTFTLRIMGDFLYSTLARSGSELLGLFTCLILSACKFGDASVGIGYAVAAMASCLLLAPVWKKKFDAIVQSESACKTVEETTASVAGFPGAVIHFARNASADRVDEGVEMTNGVRPAISIA